MSGDGKHRSTVKIPHKDEVIAEIVEHHVPLKRVLGKAEARLRGTG
jgi:hypothetical protein